MTERGLKYKSGLCLIGLHTAILVTLIVLRLVHGFDTSEFTTILAVIIPVFSSYTAGVIAFIIKDRHTTQDTTPTVTRVFAALLFVAPSILGCVILAPIILQAFRLAFTDFEDFKAFLITVESALGAYVNVLVFGIFDKQKAK